MDQGDQLGEGGQPSHGDQLGQGGQPSQGGQPNHGGQPSQGRQPSQGDQQGKLSLSLEHGIGIVSDPFDSNERPQPVRLGVS